MDWCTWHFHWMKLLPSNKKEGGLFIVHALAWKTVRCVKEKKLVLKERQRQMWYTSRLQFQATRPWGSKGMKIPSPHSRRQRKVDLQFEANLVYTTSSRPARKRQWDPGSKTKTQKEGREEEKRSYYRSIYMKSRLDIHRLMLAYS